MAKKAPRPRTLADDLRDGKLEQTCPTCGRWEAAHAYCSNCFRPMTEADWYWNGDQTERRRRMPAAAPTRATLPLPDREDRTGLRDPAPVEYRAGADNWPSAWGPWPYGTHAPRKPQTPLKRGSERGSGTRIPSAG